MKTSFFPFAIVICAVSGCAFLSNTIPHPVSKTFKPNAFLSGNDLILEVRVMSATQVPERSALATFHYENFQGRARLFRYLDVEQNADHGDVKVSNIYSAFVITNEYWPELYVYESNRFLVAYASNTITNPVELYEYSGSLIKRMIMTYNDIPHSQRMIDGTRYSATHRLMIPRLSSPEIYDLTSLDKITNSGIGDLIKQTVSSLENHSVVEWVTDDVKYLICKTNDYGRNIEAVSAYDAAGKISTIIAENTGSFKAANSIYGDLWYLRANMNPLASAENSYRSENIYTVGRFDGSEQYTIKGYFSCDAVNWDPVHERILFCPEGIDNLVCDMRKPFVIWYYKEDRKVNFLIDTKDYEQTVQKLLRIE
jgi:hypothetical protein